MGKFPLFFGRWCCESPPLNGCLPVGWCCFLPHPSRWWCFSSSALLGGAAFWEGGSTTQKQRETAAPPKRSEGRKHHTQKKETPKRRRRQKLSSPFGWGFFPPPSFGWCCRSLLVGAAFLPLLRSVLPFPLFVGGAFFPLLGLVLLSTLILWGGAAIPPPLAVPRTVEAQRGPKRARNDYKKQIVCELWRRSVMRTRYRQSSNLGLAFRRQT